MCFLPGAVSSSPGLVFRFELPLWSLISLGRCQVRCGRFRGILTPTVSAFEHTRRDLSSRLDRNCDVVRNTSAPKN